MSRRTTPLLAVVLLAATPSFAERVNPRRLPSGSPACANVLDKHDKGYLRCLAGYPDEPVPPLAPTPMRLPTKVELVVVASHALHSLGVALPRVLKDGAPACGNVASRASKPRVRGDCLPRTWLVDAASDPDTI